MSTDVEQRLKLIEERNRTYQEVAEKSAHDIAREDRAFLLALVRKYREALEISVRFMDAAQYGQCGGFNDGCNCFRCCALRTAKAAINFNPERPSHESHNEGRQHN